jgi:sugar (pentulose or hexulose) kinase
MLSAGMALRWLRVPYLVGERSPLMDPKAQAGFIGMALRHGPKHFVRAVLEGVAFALRQIVDTMVDCGADLTRLVASGNGLANPVWGAQSRSRSGSPDISVRRPHGFMIDLGTS